MRELALLGFLARLLFSLAKRQHLLEDLAHVIEFFVVQVMDALAALGRKVDQIIVATHAGNRNKRKVKFRRGSHLLRVFAT